MLVIETENVKKQNVKLNKILSFVRLKESKGKRSEKFLANK
jgi:hypothetical protein